jgi:DnaJ-class molecular chaperone
MNKNMNTNINPNPNTMSYYSLFSLPKSFTPPQLRHSYHQLLLKQHPDKGGTADQAALINQAYQTLADPVLRARYDALGAGGRQGWVGRVGGEEDGLMGEEDGLMGGVEF